jgi:hypothetical protein
MNYRDQIVRGGGPENSKYDRRRHDQMKLRPIGSYGQIFIGLKAIPNEIICTSCSQIIHGSHLIINNEHYHYGGCFECE